MDCIVYLVYPALAVLLFYGCRPCKKGCFNEELLPLNQSKAFQAFCAVCIVLHHVSHRSCAPWLAEVVRHSGLEPFINIGYIAVAFFLFYSGFGLYKSLKTKDNYFECFFSRRIFPILLRQHRIIRLRHLPDKMRPDLVTFL